MRPRCLRRQTRPAVMLPSADTAHVAGPFDRCTPAPMVWSEYFAGAVSQAVLMTDYEPLRPTLLEEVKQRLRGQGIRAAMVMGSAARGSALEGSDLDVLAVSDDATSPPCRFERLMHASA